MGKKASKSLSSGVSCHNCPAMCCRYVASEIDAPTSKREYDNIRWYLMHRDVYVFIGHDDLAAGDRGDHTGDLGEH